MRRPLGYLLAWLTATAVAVGGSWVGLQPLLDAAAAERPPALSAPRLREAAGPSPSPTASHAAPPVAPSPTAVTAVTDAPAPTAEPPPESGWRLVDGGEVLERAFAVSGGEVVFRASRVEVDVISHTAEPGYEVSVERWARDSVVVSFESPQHTSRVWVTWRDGPYAEITETA